jgi:hypothetical protein
VLLLIDIVLNAAVLVSASNEVDRVRGDFCSWARVHAQAAASSPPSPAHSADAASDRLLVQRLGC